ncbi:MAG: ATP-binding protein [Lachnospiraceae bacterium]|nr:ATP-binding protein [Lachnospiraceae bacterium]
MLVQYSVRNYKSIKDEIVINFSADDKYKNSSWTINDNSIPVHLYKCIGLIGPNASGKTNIIDSLIFASRYILNTIKRKDSEKINIIPFAFDNNENSPSSFEFIFYNNGIKYIYGFSINNKEVLEEYLMECLSKEPGTIFDRSPGQHYEFYNHDLETQNSIVQKTNANRLYMPVAAEWGYAPLKDIYIWFEFNFRQYNYINTKNIINEIIKKEERKKILISQLQKADFNIKDIYFKNKKLNQAYINRFEKIFNEITGINEENIFPDVIPELYIIHENCNGGTFTVELDEDSAGTESIVENIAEFLYLSEHGGLMLEDELGKTYHTKLTQHFLNMFKPESINPGNLQLLFTTHNTHILNILNPDQIYLTDKDETGATVIKLLDDYFIDENCDIELGYLKGRYGSIPYMKG